MLKKFLLLFFPLRSDMPSKARVPPGVGLAPSAAWNLPLQSLCHRIPPPRQPGPPSPAASQKRGKLFCFQLELFYLQFNFFAHSPLRHFLDTLSHCKQRSSTVSKKASPVSKKAQTASKRAPKHNCKQKKLSCKQEASNCKQKN